MYISQYPDLFVTYIEVFDMNTGNENPIVVYEDLPLSKQTTSSPVVFDSERKY